MAADKIDAVKKVGEAFNNPSVQPVEELEKAAPNADRFHAMLDTPGKNFYPSFERLDGKSIEGTQNIENSPTFGEENVSSQKSGSATDQENKRQKQEMEEVDEINKSDEKEKLPSPIEELTDNQSSHSTIATGQANFSDLRKEAQKTVRQLSDVRSHVERSSSVGEIKSSQRNLLNKHLTHIDDGVKIALSKAGIEHIPPPSLPTKDAANPLKRFAEFLTHSQHQLQNLDETVAQMNSRNSITPVDMIAIQVKMGYIQQQIELFTNLLNKALESTRTIMNVQV
jgi:hypothetical protein